MVERKRWKELVRPGEWHHLAVILFLPGRPSRYHTHDFPEVFWVQRGEGRHRINGREKRIAAGDLVFVRPEDEHVLEAADARGFLLVNLAYHPAVRADLLRRHPDELAPLLAARGGLPRRVQIPSAAIAALRKQLLPLAGPRPSRLALEHFLLGLHWLTLPNPDPKRPSMPDWLRQACEEIQRPEFFTLGAAGLAKAANRSAEHVARTVRAVFDLTPSDYVNRVRMDHAARELRLSARPIAEIALDCGLANLSHFYVLFRAACGTTPRSYRLDHQRTVA